MFAVFRGRELGTLEWSVNNSFDAESDEKPLPGKPSVSASRRCAVVINS